MSDTETGIMPRPHEVVSKHDGLIRWRPEFESVRIELRAEGGRRLILTGYSGEAFAFDLSAEQARHLAELLV